MFYHSRKRSLYSGSANRIDDSYRNNDGKLRTPTKEIRVEMGDHYGENRNHNMNDYSNKLQKYSSQVLPKKYTGQPLSSKAE